MGMDSWTYNEDMDMDINALIRFIIGTVGLVGRQGIVRTVEASLRVE